MARGKGGRGYVDDDEHDYLDTYEDEYDDEDSEQDDDSPHQVT
jgi:hypothetical protein